MVIFGGETESYNKVRKEAAVLVNTYPNSCVRGRFIHLNK